MATNLHIHPMGQPHGPGWSVDDRRGDRGLDDPSTCLYQLWAPRAATESRPARDHYAVAWWTGDGLTESGYRRADTAEAALACFPNTRQARAAKQQLLTAVKEQNAEGQP